MHLETTVLNRYDRTLSAEDALPILRTAIDNSGFKYIIKDVRRYTPAIETYYISLGFEELGMGVNGKGSTETIALASLFGEACERLQAAVNYSRYVPHLIPYVRYAIGEGRACKGYAYGHQSDFPNAVEIERFFEGQMCQPKWIERIKSADVGKHWVDGYSLVHKKTVKVPLKFVTQWNSSNGVAAGVTYEEAILQGSTEIMERYGLRLLMDGKRERPIVPVQQFDDKTQGLVEVMQKHGFNITFRDFSDGRGIPALCGMIECLHEPRGKLSRLYAQFGSSLNLSYAAERCITEYFQGWEPMIVMLRAVPTIPHVSWHRAEKLYDTDVGSFTGDLSYFDDYIETSKGWKSPGNTTTSHISYFTELARQEDTDLIVVDMTKEFCGIPTVRVIIPGFSEYANIEHNLSAGEKWVNEFMEFTSHSYQVLNEWVRYAELFGRTI